MAFINQSPSLRPQRTSLVAQLLKEQQRQHSKAPNPYSWGEAAARVGSRLIDAYMGKKQIDEEMGRRGASADNLQDAITALTEGTTKPGVPVDTVTQDPFAQRPIALDPNVFGTDADVGSAAVAPTVVSALTNMGATSADLGGRPANIPQASTAQDLMGATHVMPDGTTMLNSDMTGAMYETPQMNLGGQPPAGSQMQQAMAQQIAQAGQSQDVVQDRAAGIGAMGQVLMRDPTNASMGADIMFKDAMRQESEERARIAANASRKTERPLTPQELKDQEYDLGQLGGRMVMGAFEGPNLVSARIVNNPTSPTPSSERFAVFKNGVPVNAGQFPDIPSTVLKSDFKEIGRLEGAEYTVGALQRTAATSSGGTTENDTNDQQIAVMNAFDSATVILEASDEALQEVGGFARIASGLAENASMFLSMSSFRKGHSAETLRDMQNYVDIFEELGVENTVAQGNFLELALAFASAKGLGDNKALSDADVKRAMRRVGGQGVTTAKAKRALIMDTLRSLDSGFRNTYEVRNKGKKWEGTFGYEDMLIRQEGLTLVGHVDGEPVYEDKNGNRGTRQ